MIKKIKKTTSIAAALMAVTAISTNTEAAAVENLEVMEGTMNSIHNYKNGTYVFDGYRSDEYDTSGYYFNGEHDIEIDEIDSDLSSYGSKYITFGADETLFNIETGMIEEETQEDKEIMMELNFQLSKVNKAEKYESMDSPELKFIKRLNNSSYGDEWFEYKVSAASGKSFLTYLSVNGQHLDASEGLGIIVHEKQEDGSVKKVEISKAKDLSENGYEKADEDRTVFATNDYIYRIVKIKRKGSTDEVMTYLQQISKEQGKMKKGVYQPKSIVSYQINEDDTIMSIFENNEENDYIYFDMNNSLYIGYYDGDELSIEKYNLKKTKESRLDKRVVEFDDEIVYKGVKAVAQDCNEDLWVVSKGKVSKFVNDNLEAKYLVDRSYNNISVYNEENLSLWNTENNIYSIVSNKETAKEEEVSDEAFVKEEIELSGQGWSKNNNQEVIFINESGDIHIGWLKDNNKWYYMNESGIMQKGWLQNNGLWYYLQEDGTMKTGWLKDSDNNWYYLKEDGSMAFNESVDGYNLGINGAWIN